MFADLAAERPIAAERAGRKIVVEIKSFTGRSPMRDFEQALGQYLVYKRWLALTEADRKLYLAISEPVYDRLFSRQAIRVIVESEGLNLLVVNLQREEVIVWTS